MNEKRLLNRIRPFTLVTGHYGCGKTNLAVNLAIDAAKEGEQVTIVDMDLVNPYFRTSDYRKLLEDHSIEVITPVFGATNLDIPSLPASMYSIFERKGRVIVDVGGDDVGSTVLGRFRPQLGSIDFDMIYVVNRFRSLTTTAKEAVEILREIEVVSGLKATGIVNNSHLMSETSDREIAEGIAYAGEVSRLTDLKVIANTAPKPCIVGGSIDPDRIPLLYEVDIYTGPCYDLPV